MADQAYYESKGGMTRMDVINEAETRLLAQGEFCYDKWSGQCAYGKFKGPDPENPADEGRTIHCAIGILPGFPEWLNNASGSAAHLFDRYSELSDLFASDVTGEFLTYVQSKLHDNLVEAQELSKTQEPKVEFVFADAIRAAADKLRKEIL